MFPSFLLDIIDDPGADDMISFGGSVYVVKEEGSLRRCGGQGDVLAGALGLLSFWADTVR